MLRYLTIIFVLFISVIFPASLTHACEKADAGTWDFVGQIPENKCPGRGIACLKKDDWLIEVPNFEASGTTDFYITRSHHYTCPKRFSQSSDKKQNRWMSRYEKQNLKNMARIVEEQGLSTEPSTLMSELIAPPGKNPIRLQGLADAEDNIILPAIYRRVTPFSDRFVWVWDLDRRNRLIDLKTMKNTAYPNWDSFKMSGATVSYKLGGKYTVYFMRLEERADSYDLAAIGPDGSPLAVFPNLRGKYKDRNSGQKRSLLVQQNGNVLLFGYDRDKNPITYKFRLDEPLKALPGGLDFFPVFNRYAQKESQHGYMLLRPIGLLPKSIGSESRVYYESFDPVTLEPMSVND